MAVYAPDSKKCLEMYEDCISNVFKVFREGRRGGARSFYSTGDFNVELGLMCKNEKDNEELTKMYGPANHSLYLGCGGEGQTEPPGS